MYEILMDGKHLWYPGDKECVVFSPTLTESLNDAGYLEFKVPQDNPLYRYQHGRSLILEPGFTTGAAKDPAGQPSALWNTGFM